MNSSPFMCWNWYIPGEWGHCRSCWCPVSLRRQVIISMVLTMLNKQAGIILCMRPANERRRYSVTSSLIGWAHAQNAPWTGGWVGLWGFLWWAPSAKRKDHHGVSSGWSSVWHRSNTGLSSTQYEQIPIILGVWPFWLTPFFFQSITFWRAYG